MEEERAFGPFFLTFSIKFVSIITLLHCNYKGKYPENTGKKAEILEIQHLFPEFCPFPAPLGDMETIQRNGFSGDVYFRRSTVFQIIDAFHFVAG